MARDDALLCIDQHRHIEAETRDALGDLPHLLAAVQPRVLWIKLQCHDRFVADGQVRRAVPLRVSSARTISKLGHPCISPLRRRRLQKSDGDSRLGKAGKAESRALSPV